MRAQKDPIAVALSEKYAGVHMPNLGMTENDAADLITYLEAQTARLDEAEGPPMPAHDHSGHQHHHH